LAFFKEFKSYFTKKIKRRDIHGYYSMVSRPHV